MKPVLTFSILDKSVILWAKGNAGKGAIEGGWCVTDHLDRTVECASALQAARVLRNRINRLKKNQFS